MLHLDLEKLSRLPTLPTVAVEILRSFANPEVRMDEIARLIQADPALTGKVLAAANSVRFGVGRPVADLQRATLLLGKKVIGSLALGFSLAAASMRRGPEAPYFQRLWLQCFTQGLAAKTLAERYGGSAGHEAFCIGLVARVGQLALLRHAFSEYRLCLDEAKQAPVPLEVIEEQQLGFTSRDLTCKILTQWKLPPSFLQALRCRCLSATDADPDHPPAAPTPLQTFVVVGGCVADFIGAPQRGIALVHLHDAVSTLSEQVEDEVEWLIASVTQQLQANSALFQVDLTGIGTPDELLSEATEQLTRLMLEQVTTDTDGEPSAQHLLAENGELRKKVEQLTRESSTDPLTGLFNRRWLHRNLQEVIDRSYAQRTFVGLLLGDVDRFKSVNDTYGHPAGDQVLREVAQTMQRTLRSSDLLARYGGEEFAVVSEVTSVEQLQTLAERLRAAVANTPIQLPTGELRVTISFGGILGRPTGDVNEFESRILGETDRCLYEAKEAGRNRCVCRQLDPRGRDSRPFLARSAPFPLPEEVRSFPVSDVANVAPRRSRG